MCVSPVALTREIAGRKYTQYVPCGKCNQCIADRQNEYVIRTMEEATKRGSMWFFTLTYSNENVPYTFDLDGEIVEEDPETGEVFFSDDAKLLSLNRADITEWKKRVRNKLNKRRKKNGQSPLDFGYMIAGEYGPKTHRPHYHGVFLGLSKEDVMEFKKDWEEHFGFTSFSYIPVISCDGRNQVEATAKYVSKYVVKMHDLEDPNVINGKVQKPRKQTSVGYGMPTRARFERMRNYHLCNDIYPNLDPDKVYDLQPSELKRIVNQIIRRRKYRKPNGKETKLPNYYKRKIFYIPKEDGSGSVRATELQKVVSRSMEMQLRAEFARKLCQMAALYDQGDPIEAHRRASRDLCRAEEDSRLAISSSLFETNIRSLRKSKF